jgi:hypothetical protein
MLDITLIDRNCKYYGSIRTTLGKQQPEVIELNGRWFRKRDDGKYYELFVEGLFNITPLKANEELLDFFEGIGRDRELIFKTFGIPKTI